MLSKISGSESSVFAGAITHTGHSFTSDSGRHIMAALPAALITAGLFVLMNGLIQVDEVTLDPSPQRILGKIVFDEAKTPEPERLKPAFEPVEAQAPPPPPKITISRGEVGLPPIRDVGSVPARTPIGSLGSIMTAGSPMIDRTATPVRPPLPTYPRAMAQGNIEGDCLVTFGLTTRGFPFDVVAQCTHAGFESEARRAVSKAEFLPRIFEGQAQESIGLTYPLEFRLNDG